jgi:hypothetical protein
VLRKLFPRFHASAQFALIRYNPAVPTVFVHIPKTSGVAITNALIEALAPTRTLVGFDGALFGSFHDFDSLAPELRGSIYLDPAKLPLDVGLVAAHMSVSTAEKAYPKGQYLTLLREPYSRILSHWVFWRTLSDELLMLWGTWAHVLKQARNPLSEFLSCRQIACQTDNIFIRMLLWPHSLIPSDDFIKSRNDEKLLAEAITRLKRFAYVDLLENPNLQINLETWLGRPCTYKRVNETGSVPAEFKTPLHAELTSRAFDLLQLRARLDLRLWLMFARDRVEGLEAEVLRERILVHNVARFSMLMA